VRKLIHAGRRQRRWLTMPIANAGLHARKAVAAVPGILLCLACAALAFVIQLAEERAFAHPYVEAVVLAILLGMIVRSVWRPGPRWAPGIAFSAKFLLELAVMMLGASISFGSIAASGTALLAGIVGAVVLALVASYAISRALGLTHHLSILIACGNSICGNSAIAAVAPIIGAGGQAVASAIAFTAVLGVGMVLALPLASPLFHLSETQYGTLAGLTVYAVPQVLAATLPVGLVATQIGTLVKLVRVLMLAPIVVLLCLFCDRLQRGADRAADAAKKPGLPHLVPWFIVGFVLLAGLRSLGLIPDVAVSPAASASFILTIISMSALGLEVDLRLIGRVGPRVTFAVTGSLIVLFVISMALIRALGIA
jgi:uncharacterized integral membrane protein (TIGR00698 family)